jgi:EmrB/QacA subfamily drug resistance transporter
MDAPAQPGLKPYRLLLTTVGIAVFMSSLDVTIVNISLPTIARDFGAGTTTVSWVIMSYQLVMCSFMPAFGRLGDIRGYRVIFTTGYAIFVTGSFLCGISAGIGMLIGSRILQGIGASMLAALTSAIVMGSLPTAIRGRALGFVAMFASLGIALGPAIGGFLTTYLSWHWIFFINVPVGIAGFLIAARTVPDAVTTADRRRFDPLGAVFIFFALLATLYVLNQGHTIGWTSPLAIAFAIAACIFAALFVFWERRVPSPLFDLSLFSSRNFVCANFASMIVMLTFAGALFLFPFYFENVFLLSTDTTGLVLTIPSAAIFIAGPLMGAVADRAGSRIPCLVSAILLGAGFLVFGMFGPEGSHLLLGAGLLVMGFGVGGFLPANTVMIMAQAPPEGSGAVSSMMMTLRNIGSVIGVAVFETLLTFAVLRRVPAGSVTSVSDIPSGMLLEGFRFVFLFGTMFCVLAFILVLLTRGSCRPADRLRDGGGFL